MDHVGKDILPIVERGSCQMAAAGVEDILVWQDSNYAGHQKEFQAGHTTTTLPYTFYYGKEGKSKSYPCQARLLCRHWLQLCQEPSQN